ncbi:MAG TPA: 4Fe-4S binding protein [Thermodesulfobacteriota bacterium]|nr:4Fe-4S binding protein [Thermodesulfobacteriota bacterium]
MKTHSSQIIKQLCLEAGADDVGLVDVDREALDKEREGISYVYPLTRSIISIVVAHNRENLQTPARYVANEEYHHTGDRTSGLAREILRRLNRIGIRGVVVNKGWPMDLDRYPGKIWDVSHKIMAVEAGLGHMGLNRLVLHPRFGSAIQLDSILVDGIVDQYDSPLKENPCIHCNLCAVVCPTGAITKGQPFDFFACITHTYRDNMTGFQDWVEAMVTSRDMAEYNTHFTDRETAFMWQSLMFRMSYRCSYCMSVCPAGEEVKSGYLENKKEHVERIVKPLRDRKESVYVLAGSKSETRVRKNPHKEVRVVPGMLRTPPK